MKKTSKELNEIEHAYYQYEISQTNSLIEQIKIVRKYVSLICSNWICQDCFHKDYALTDQEIVCLNCATVDDGSSELWINKIHQSPFILWYGLQSTHIIGQIYDRNKNFLEILSKYNLDYYTVNLMNKDYKNLEKKFEKHKDLIKRKKLFSNKIIIQTLLEDYKLADSKPMSKAMKVQYDQIKWLTL